MNLRLEGHFSYISKYNKLVFTHLDVVDTPNETREKLARHCPDGSAHNRAGFTVGLSRRDMKGGIPEDIQGLVGLDCIVHVVIAPYNFVSKLETNFGEAIVGNQLVLEDIKAMAKYT